MLRFDDGDVAIAPEMFDIEGQELGDAVDVHRGNEPSIMRLGTDDGIPCDELSPFLIGGEAIRQEEVVLNDPSSAFGFGRREAEAPAGGRPGAWRRSKIRPGLEAYSRVSLGVCGFLKGPARPLGGPGRLCLQAGGKCSYQRDRASSRGQNRCRRERNPGEAEARVPYLWQSPP